MRTKNGLDPIDCELLQCVQDEFPLDPRPYRILASRLGISEEEALRRLNSLSMGGILKHIAPILEMTETGVTASTLVAMRVAEDRIDEIAGIVSEYRSVSHNYRRDHEYNLWFTIAESGDDQLKETLEEIRQRSGVLETDIINLPIVQRFKIDVRFRFIQENRDEEIHGRDRP